MRTVRVETDSWIPPTGFMAATFWDRYKGIKAVDGEGPLILPSKSIHTFGLGEPIRVVAVGDDSRVRAVRTIGPNRLAHFKDAVYVIESGDTTDGPAVGEHVSLSDV